MAEVPEDPGSENRDAPPVSEGSCAALAAENRKLRAHIAQLENWIHSGSRRTEQEPVPAEAHGDGLPVHADEVEHREIISIFESMGDGVIVFAKNGSVRLMNPAAAKMLGFRDTSEACRDFAGFVTLFETRDQEGNLVPAELWPATRALAGETANDLVIHAYRRDIDHHCVASYRAMPVRNRAGAVERVIVTMCDLGDLERARNAAKESEERFRTLADNIAQFAWTADEKGNLEWYNQRWYDYTGTTLEEMRGWGWMKVHHPDHLQRVIDRVQHSWDTGEPWEDTFPLRSKDGTYRWFLSRARPIRDSEGRVVRWFGTNTDITEQREAEERLRLALAESERLLFSNEELKQLMYAAAHDLREPLRTIGSFVQLLLRRKAQFFDQDSHEYAAYILQGVDRMGRMIEALLGFRQAALEEITAREIELERPVLAALADVAALIQETGATVTTDPLDVHVIADPQRLSGVLQNLLSNAMKYRAKEPPEIHIFCRSEGDSCVVAVRDNGVGIAPEHQERAFRMFTRLEPGLAWGTGMGLALSRKIVERHGGKMWVESEPGKGSTFYFTLPLALRRSTSAGS